MLDAHAHVMQVKLCKANTRGVTSRGSHHPSHECFMAGTPEGYVESIYEGEATPTNDLNNEVEGDVGAPPRLQVEQLRAQHQEIEEARL